MRLLEHEIELSISLNSDTYPQAPKYADAGFAACELVFPVSYYEPANMTSYREHLGKVYPFVRESGLRVAAYHIPFGKYWDISATDETIRSGAVQAVAAMMELVSDHEGKNVVLHPSWEPIADAEREAHIAACIRSLEELAPLAARAGKRIALEDLPRTCLGHTSEEMARLTREGTLCGVCMDTTHLFHETPQDFLDRCGKWVINAHLSDYLNGQDECHWVPGTGSLNWRAIFEKLFAFGYVGTFNFEVFRYVPLEILNGLKNALTRG